MAIRFESPATSAGSELGPQRRLIDLLEYIEQVEKMNRTPPFEVPSDFYRAYEDELRKLPQVALNLADDEIWLRVPRLKESEPPQPSAALRPWIVVTKSAEKEPTLRDETVIAPAAHGEDPRKIDRRDVPQVDTLFKQYVEGVWRRWAADEAPRRRTIAVYNKLFFLQQAMEAEGAETQLELVWGIGVALWKHPSGQRIQYPLITQLVEVALDPETLALDIRPRERLPSLEADAYAVLGVPGVANLEATWKAYLEKADGTPSPFDPNSVAALLRPAVGFLDASGSYWPDSEPTPTGRSLPQISENLVLTDTWVLFARKRSPNFLIEDLQRLRSNLAQLTEIPVGPAALVSELPDEVIENARIHFRGRCFGPREGASGEAICELYFPKPYNSEQVSIVEKLEQSPGVVVQGPPGTGKTHTIANVICHYLANGKRVLVTSKGEPALAVLREQIPESVRPLTVALLTDERDGMRQFEHAIQTIASQVARIQPDELDRAIQTEEARLEEVHASLAITDREIADWARKHLSEVSFAGRQMRPEELARLVIEQKEAHSWFPDRLTGEFNDPAVLEADIQVLRQARRTLGPDLAYLDIDLPSAADFCDAARIGSVHASLVEARALEEHIQSNKVPRLIETDDTAMASAEKMLAQLAAAIAAHAEAYGRQSPGTESLHRAYEGRGNEALARLDDVVAAGADLNAVRQLFIARPVEVHGDADLDLEFNEAIERLCEGKSPLGLLAFGKARVKAHVAAVRVSGLPATASTDWQHVSAELGYRTQVRSFVARWNAVATELELTQIEHSSPDLGRALHGHVEHVRTLRRLATEHQSEISRLWGLLFGDASLAEGATRRRESLDALRKIVTTNLTRCRLEGARQTLNSQLKFLYARKGTISLQMREFLKDTLGCSDLGSEQVSRKWEAFLRELRRLSESRDLFSSVNRVTDLIRQSGADQWAHRLRTEPVTGTTDPWLPASWLDAWRWRDAATFVEAIDDRQTLKALESKRLSSEQALAHTYGKLVEVKTWREVHRNSPPSVKAALQAYLNAVRAIGKGTGIRAVRHRKAARAAMMEAHRAVPCWIMPQWRVSETLPPEIGKFDLVIVDEASQSDLWVLPSLLRGRKIMVVGDDKQVSPDGIGISEERIKDLKNRFLNSQVHREQMTPEKSMYDLAKVVFAGEMVVLREHFRCVASIIEFSKREFYSHQVQPLRVPKASERLDPPLVDVFVRGGTRSGKVNLAEAKAILEEMKAILLDPRCKGRSMGVVSLLGIEQAHKIFELIKDQIPAEEIIGRKITVGDARTFQGKERDIMLLSMVATPDNQTSFTAQMYEQRFNVAASRARDRMYLFRSVELSDLSKMDLKAKLIEHFRAPFHQEPRRVQALRELCESDFERDMFDVLTHEGFRVQPQVEAGAYRIDLVVEGAEDRRLAIECDGDQYHGPERWNADMARQRVLERAGWAFWRCFGTSFRHDREGVLEDLFQTLQRMGIEPIGAAGVELGGYTEHRVVGLDEVDEASEPEEAVPAREKEQGAASSHVELAEAVAPPGVSGFDGSGSFHIARRNQPSALMPVSDTQENQPKGEGEVARGNPSAVTNGEYSDEVFLEFANRHAMEIEDNRSKRGALWVRGNSSPDISRQLKLWGFQFAAKKGWWRK